MAKGSNPPNRGGSGPNVTKQSAKRGPIIGKMASVSGGGTIQPTRNKGSNKGMNFGKNVKKR